ncbi:membrane hypothetical protein [Sphingomonas sp. AX6]|nr:membrane hypothetical protein [Sphingomonas sp. AX6]
MPHGRQSVVQIMVSLPRTATILAILTAYFAAVLTRIAAEFATIGATLGAEFGTRHFATTEFATIAAAVLAKFARILATFARELVPVLADFAVVAAIGAATAFPIAALRIVPAHRTAVAAIDVITRTRIIIAVVPAIIGRPAIATGIIGIVIIARRAIAQRYTRIAIAIGAGGKSKGGGNGQPDGADTR